MIKFCNNCQVNVVPTKKFNTGVFLILLCCTPLFGVLSIIYIIYYALKSAACPQCKGTSFSMAREAFARSPAASNYNYEQQNTVSSYQATTTVQDKQFCGTCGSKLSAGSTFCTECDSKRSGKWQATK